MSLDFQRQNKGKKTNNPLISTEGEKPNAALRRNIKLPDSVFYKLRALMKVKDAKQYELVEMTIDNYVEQMSKQEKTFYDFQLEEIIKKNSK